MAFKEITVPDIGDFKAVEVIEVLVALGDTVSVEQPLITLESDKAAMEIPSPNAGVIKELKVATGDKVSEGSVIAMIEITEVQNQPVSIATPPHSQPLSPSIPPINSIREDLRRPGNLPTMIAYVQPVNKPHAGPAVRHLARDLGVDLIKVVGSGRKGRILKEDVQAFVKQVMTEGTAPGVAVIRGGGMGIPEIPEIDFSQFGEIETRPLNRIKKLSGANLHKSWLNVPHVTQFDETDITDLEQFRKDLATEAQKHNVKVTMLAFLLRASVSALQQFPDFNASLDPSRENLIIKKYYHIGVAVDTPEGLVVPVIKKCG